MICVKCDKDRPKEWMVKGRKHCKICDGYGSHLNTSAPMSFAGFEHEFTERRRREGEGVKVCPICKAEKPVEEFHLPKSRCKPCHSKVAAEEKRNSRAKKAALEGRLFVPKSLADSHVFAMKRHLRAQERKKKSIKNPALLEHRKWLSAANDNDVSRYYETIGKPWNNPRLTSGEKFKIRYANDNEFAVKQRIRAQKNKARKRSYLGELMRATIKRGGRSRIVERAFHYSIKDLCAHLESLFADGMTWEAFMRGEIHIDHIKPQSAFDLSDDEQFAQCWALSNLQPLWAADNLAKSDRLPCGARARHRRAA